MSSDSSEYSMNSKVQLTFTPRKVISIFYYIVFVLNYTSYGNNLNFLKYKDMYVHVLYGEQNYSAFFQNL